MFITMESTFVFPKKIEKGMMITSMNKSRSILHYLEKHLQVQCIKEKVSAGDIKGAQEIGRKLADRNRVRQLRAEMLAPDQNTDHHSMEAVAIFKEACDKVDPYHIFQNEWFVNEHYARLCI